MRADNAVEPTKSENITVTWRRSARSLGGTLGAVDVVATSAEDDLARASVRRAAMASNNLRRCPSAATPSSSTEGSMDVVVWLRSLGLGKYEALFQENDIDETVLPNLTAEDLKELGVASLGHRRKLLDAIAALRADTNPAPAATAGPVALDASPRDTAERRQVTVMFSDLVGSTALSARMDPEDLREVISAYQKCVADTVQRFGGFVAKYMGDGVLVYFGYPQAHEDDAERAVRAGLELVAAVGGLKTHASLQTRVGMATGLVVVDQFGALRFRANFRLLRSLVLLAPFFQGQQNRSKSPSLLGQDIFGARRMLLVKPSLDDPRLL